jgi:hypothetical protein
VSWDHPFRGFEHQETKEEGEHFYLALGEIMKQYAPSIRGGHMAEIKSPSVFQIPEIWIDRGFLSLGVASHEIAKQFGPSIRGGHVAIIQDFGRVPKERFHRYFWSQNSGVPLTRGQALVFINPERNRTEVLWGMVT